MVRKDSVRKRRRLVKKLVRVEDSIVARRIIWKLATRKFRSVRHLLRTEPSWWYAFYILHWLKREGYIIYLWEAWDTGYGKGKGALPVGYTWTAVPRLTKKGATFAYYKLRIRYPMYVKKEGRDWVLKRFTPVSRKRRRRYYW